MDTVKDVGIVEAVFLRTVGDESFESFILDWRGTLVKVLPLGVTTLELIAELLMNAS